MIDTLFGISFSSLSYLTLSFVRTYMHGFVASNHTVSACISISFLGTLFSSRELILNFLIVCNTLALTWQGFGFSKNSDSSELFIISQILVQPICNILFTWVAYTGYTEDPVLSRHKSLEKRRTPPPAPPSLSPSPRPNTRPIPAVRTILPLGGGSPQQGEVSSEPPVIAPRTSKPSSDPHDSRQVLLSHITMTQSVCASMFS